jgi:hypothetical protein
MSVVDRAQGLYWTLPHRETAAGPGYRELSKSDAVFDRRN